MSAKRILPVLFFLFPFYLRAQAPSLIVPVGGDAAIAAVRFDEERRYFTTISRGTDIKIKGWETRTERLHFSIYGLRKAEFSEDGRYIIALDNENNCILFQSFTGKRLLSINGKNRDFKSVSLSSGAKYILAICAGDSAMAMVWKTATGQLLHSVNLGKYLYVADMDIFNTCFSPDERTIATSSIWEPSVSVWELTSGKLLKKLSDTTVLKTGLAFSPDGQSLLSWSGTGFKIWDSRSGKLRADIHEQLQLLPYHRFSPDGQYLVTGSEAGPDTAKVWDVTSGRLLFRLFRGNQFGFGPPAFSKDSRYIATLTEDKQELKLVDCRSGRLATVIHDTVITPEGRIAALGIQKYVFAPDNRSVLTVGITRCIRAWDIQTGNLVHELDSLRATAFEPEIVSFVQFSRDGNYIEKVYSDGRIQVYDHPEGKLLREFMLVRKPPKFSKPVYNPNGKQWLMNMGRKLVVWDRLNGKVQFFISDSADQGDGFTSASFSPDGSMILVSSIDGSARCWNSNDGQLLLTIWHMRGVTTAAFDPSGRYVVTGCGDSTVRIWDIRERKLVRALPQQKGIILETSFSPDGQFIYTSSFPPNALIDVGFGPISYGLHRQVDIWRSDSNIHVARLDSVNLVSAQFSPVSGFLIFNLIAGVRVWNWSTGELTPLYGNGRNTLQRAFFTPDQKYSVLVCNDSTYFFKYPGGEQVKSFYFPAYGYNMVIDHTSSEMMIANAQQTDFYHADNFRRRYSIISIDSVHHLLLLPDGYYQCMPGVASQLYYVSRNRQFITFEQLDVKYNRPDKVLEAIGNTDTALIKSYRKAWEKRIKKLGIDTTAFRDGYSVPECDFVNRDKIKSEQKTRTLTLRIKGMDSTYQLDRFNVWVNESPVFGQRGISLRGKKSKSLDTTITIQLSQGENRIETSISNVNGTESYRMPLVVSYTPAVKQKETLRFIGIGIDRFADPKNNLQYSCKDIRDLTMKLKERYKDDIIIDTLFNENVTAEKVKALKQKLKQTAVNDKVIVSYSGHGLLSRDYDYYLSTYDVNFDNPEENGLPYDLLESLLDSIPARRKLMLIDACHSGELDKEEMSRITAQADSLAKKGAKGGKPVYTGKTTLGMKNSFELMQSLFVNVGKSTGATVISAAAGTQFALERGDLKNGVFTYCLLEAMDQYPRLSVSGLKKRLSERVIELTNGLQQPTSRSEQIMVDWDVW